MSKAIIRPLMTMESSKAVDVINDAATVYDGVVASDALPTPYMSKGSFVMDIGMGVKFWCVDKGGEVLGVMGLQKIDGISLIRHAYVLKKYQRKGVGSGLLKRLTTELDEPVLVGTWRDAASSNQFYVKHGFTKIDRDEKDQLLKKYWKISDRHREESVVYANKKWFEAEG